MAVNVPFNSRCGPGTLSPNATNAERPRTTPRLGHVPDERFSEHLNHPVGRGHAVAGGHAGSAGGSICGDVVRIDVRVEGETVVDAGFDASGCGALTAAASAASTSSGARRCSRPRGSAAATSAAELGGLSAGKLHAAELAADALQRALGAAAARQAQLGAARGPHLVAMSGGVDSAVAALLSEGEVAGGDARAVADPENDAEG